MPPQGRMVLTSRRNPPQQSPSRIPVVAARGRAWGPGMKGFVSLAFASFSFVRTIRPCGGTGLAEDARTAGPIGKCDCPGDAAPVLPEAAMHGSIAASSRARLAKTAGSVRPDKVKPDACDRAIMAPAANPHPAQGRPPACRCPLTWSPCATASASPPTFISPPTAPARSPSSWSARRMAGTKPAGPN